MAKVQGVDVTTGKVDFKPAKGEKKATIEVARLAITKEQFDKLLTLAYKDGYKPDATTDKGGQAQNTRVVQTYVRLAVDGLLVKRAEDLVEEK